MSTTTTTSPTSPTCSTTQTVQAAAPVRRRRVRTVVTGALLAAATFLTLTAASAVPASAATTVAPRMTAVNCGWYIQQGALTSFVDYKVTLTNLPSVTGISSTNQLVWLYVEFAHPANGVWSTYRGTWLYTYARAGVWTNSWTDYTTRTTGNITTHDLAPESGYTGAEFTSLDTGVHETLQWMSGSTVAYRGSEWAVAPNNFNNHAVCNGGGNLF